MLRVLSVSATGRDRANARATTAWLVVGCMIGPKDRPRAPRGRRRQVPRRTPEAREPPVAMPPPRSSRYQRRSPTREFPASPAESAGRVSPRFGTIAMGVTRIVANEINRDQSTRRRLPPIETSKSSIPRPMIGCPCRSITCTSTGTTRHRATERCGPCSADAPADSPAIGRPQSRKAAAGSTSAWLDKSLHQQCSGFEAPGLLFITSPGTAA